MISLIKNNPIIVALLNLSHNLQAVIVGCLFTFAFSPFDCWPIVFVVIGYVFFLLNMAKNKKQAFWLGFSFAFAFFVSSIYWISASLLVDAKQFAWLIPFAITLIPALLSVYYGLSFMVFFILNNKISCNIWQKTLLFSVLWLASELLRATLFSGFAWNLLGYVSLSMPYIAQTADIWGVYGLTFILCFCSISFWVIFTKHKNKDHWQYLCVVVFILTTCLLYSYLRLNQAMPKNNTIWQFRLIQANIPQSEKWEEEDKIKNLDKHIKLSKNNNHLDAVIWPETAFPFLVSSLNKEQLQKTLTGAIPPQGSLISGLVYVDYQNSDLQIFNSAFNLDQHTTQLYHKHHLVPFGEYVPLQKYFNFLLLSEELQKITGDAMSFSEGIGPQTLFGKNFSFAPLICYEVVFSTKIIDKNNNPDILINLTNDAWFGNTIGPYQHLAHAKMRAIEYRKPMLRVAGTGISAHINEYGKILNQIPLNKEGFLDVKVQKSELNSLYAKIISYLTSIPITKNIF
jgi:apolipoprotein N-acyltransferase